MRMNRNDIFRGLKSSVLTSLNQYNTCYFDRGKQILGECVNCSDQLLFEEIIVNREEGTAELNFYCDNCGREYHETYKATCNLFYKKDETMDERLDADESISKPEKDLEAGEPKEEKCG